ncbi:rod shape-determining protein RodA [Acetivibrio mesophilus]|uniref:Rod shape-determining protein RodA n=1 Tax=Acetivibrio mesophilus TaxID=2487273 RepID=A0A4Q0I786_9FIRM|nr:rod shape-determining protein RodA [Acetivibrio mesophilus]ODM25174.1 rod shape-determining protein RodA [Clostridium sp. Bc-iso-3]RXE59807.1 rod shape-determining protein RodA [Acetivibrio mesophilus]HHV29589.1 rod shape-determining protein RodA [Clostridium sp.]
MYFVEKTKNSNIVKRFDYFLFLAVTFLSVIGAFVLKSAVATMPSGRRMFLVQMGSIVVGTILALIISLLDYKDFKILGIPFYIFTVVLLVLVLFIGTGEELGSRSWLNIMGFSLQPSELAKISMVLISSVFLERIYDGQKNRTANIIKFVIYTSIPIVLVMAQKDFGTTLVFVFAVFVMLFVFGISYKYILMMMGACVASLPIIWFFVLNDNRRNRIRVFLNPELDPLGAGWNVIRSKIAIGSGQIFGKGLFKGIQTQNSLVPVKESDFIFSVVGEELGFVGAVIILALVFFILMRCLYIVRNARDRYGAFLVTGITAFFAIHFIENIGMSIGLLPVTGIPLPFVSQGGSAMLTNYIAIGVVLSVSARRQKSFY